MLFRSLRAVPAEIDPATLNVTAESVAARITPQTRAVLVLHTFGAPAPVDEIASLCTARGIPVIEDGAHALRICVRDAGPGIPAAELARVFEPFYRVEASRNRATGGNGLGLTIARNVARAHGGELVLRNRAEGGLEAELTLPRRG